MGRADQFGHATRSERGPEPSSLRCIEAESDERGKTFAATGHSRRTRANPDPLRGCAAVIACAHCARDRRFEPLCEQAERAERCGCVRPCGREGAQPGPELVHWARFYAWDLLVPS